MKGPGTGGGNWNTRRVVFWTSVISILLLIEVFSLLDFAHRREEASRQAQLLSQMTAAQISAVLSHHDVRAAIQIVRRLNGQQRIIAACLYGSDGRVLGYFVRSGSRQAFSVPVIRPDGNYSAAGVITSFRSIRWQGRTLGTLYTQFDAGGFFETWEPLARFAVLLIVLSLVTAVLLSRRMQRAIADPILELTRTALRVASEKQYRNLFDRVPDPVFIVDRKSQRFLYANETASRVYGYRNEELLRMSPADLHEPSDRHCKLDDFDDGTSAVRYNTAHTARDGQRMDVEILCNQIVYEARPAWLAIARDVTIRNQVQEELERAKSAAEEASQAKSAFLANMSHEIRTPMNGILGMLALALDTPLSGELREYLTLAKSSADSLLSLLNDVMDFSKIEAGKLEFENIPFSLRNDLGEKIKSLGHLASRKGIELVWRVRPEVPDWVMGDPGRLRQILFNLVGNAIKFTEKGDVLVDTWWEEEDLTGSVLLHFLVRDTGIGLSAAQQKLIFDPFTQADSSTTRKFGGTGLGLAVVKRLVEGMGGRTWVESEPGKGSSFHFTARFGLPAPDFSPPQPQMQPAELDGLRVLVADDHPESRLIITEMLKQWRMKPEEAEDFAAACEFQKRAAAQNRPFQLFIVDAEMHTEEGPDVIAQIHNGGDFDPQQVILLGSFGFAERKDIAGFAVFLNKPVQQSELLDAILKVCIGTEREPAIPATTKRSQGFFAGRRVLLAEDNVVNQRLAARLLEKQGFSVVTANDGPEVLDLFSRRRFDMILMDVQMPGVDGLDATRLIRQRERSTGTHIPIIILTAHAMKGDRERCLASGADDYLAKPIVPAQFAAVVQRLASAEGPARVACSDWEAEQGFDSSALLERLEGDRTLLAEMVHLFDAETPALIDKAQASLNQGDFAGLQRIAHTLKGTIGNFGVGPALYSAGALEDAANHHSPASAATVLQHLEKQLTRLSESFEPFRVGIRE